ncbi:hypothetical protein RB213_007527 [Colletotrichum asianum]
MGSHHEWDQ